MADIARMRENLAAIALYPDNHDQSAWADGYEYATGITPKAGNGDHPECGTTLCFAGWDVFLHAPKGAVIRDPAVTFPNGRQQFIDHFAKEGMGLTEEQASVFFHTAKSYEDLEAMVDAVEANPHIDGCELLDRLINPDDYEDDYYDDLDDEEPEF